MKEQQSQETQMLENLRTIERAKEHWVSEASVKRAVPVTMANLTSYLGSNEVKPVVGERYDPRPVGEEPTATLPEGKHLWDYPTGAAAYTAKGLEQILANSTSNPVNLATGEFLHPSGRWLPGFWKAVPRRAPTSTVSSTLNARRTMTKSEARPIDGAIAF